MPLMPSLQTKVKQARVRLVAAQLRYANAVGEAQFTDGNRAAKNVHDEDAYQRSKAKWCWAAETRATLDRALRAYTRAVRQAGK